jgi:hypothetical protein
MAGMFLDKVARDARGANVWGRGFEANTREFRPNRAISSLSFVEVSRLFRLCAVYALVAFACVALGGREAQAAGTFKLKSSSTSEVSGAWHIFVTIELPRAPATAHVPLKFLFTKETVYERALVDGHNDPVINRTPLQNQTPSIESLDVDFADGSGKIFKGTRFDFGLTRQRGYEAGEYKVQVRTSDGTDIGGTQRITLNGENPVVDRRSITFNAKEKSIKKVDDGTDAGAKVAKNDTDDTAPVQNQDVTASGTAAPFIPAEAYQKQPEEEVKEHPAGCGCETIGHRSGADTRTGPFAFGGVALGLAAILGLRKRARRS